MVLGAILGHKFLGAFGYADDITLNTPTLHGLQKMVTICESYRSEYDMLFNESKTHCIKFSLDGSTPDVNIYLNSKLSTLVNTDTASWKLAGKQIK